LLLGVALALLAVAVLGLAAAPASAVIVQLHSGKAVSYQPLSGATTVKPLDQFFTNLDYNGGPVMRSNTNYAVYWSPSGAPPYPTGYESGVNQYLSDLAHDSGGHENTESVATQYNDASGDFARYESHFGEALIDEDPYPANGCAQAEKCLTDAQLTEELTKFVKKKGLPTDLAHEYFLLTPPKVEDCFEANGLECSAGSNNPVYCAYHGNVALAGGGELIYANDPYDNEIVGCDDGNHPNGLPSDGVIEGGLNHEHIESLTDPEPNNAWTDFATGKVNGYEIGDKCVGNMGGVLGEASNKAKYNQVINGHFYWYQQEWSNQGHACVQRFSFSGTEPTATFTSKPAGGNQVSFDASGSSAEGGVSRYSWNFGDGSASETTTATTTHKFLTTGNHLVALTVYAGDGASIGTAREIESGSVVPAPTVLTEAASATGKTSATLHATVNPNGRTVSECTLEYGTTVSYGKTATCTPSPGSGSSPVAVSAALSGLTPNTTYHFRIVATNAGGTRAGLDDSVKTLPNAPTVKTEAASSIGKTTATLNANANPNGGNVSECKLEYGTTTAYTSSAPCSPAPGSGESPVAVSAAVGGLSANTTYHFRVSATNAGGTSLGEDKSFTTLAPIPPTVATTAAATVTRTLATLNGTVNPNGSTVSDCHFEYGPTTSYGSTAPCASLPGSGTSAVAATASVGNLSPAITYHFRVSATNGGGTSPGSDQTFTTLAALPTPHWYKNGTKLALGEKSNLLGWGTLTLESSAGTATCHSAQAANVENTAGAATKEVVLFAAWECKPVGGSCTGGEQRATPRHLPWQGTMLEEGVEGSGEVREEGWGVELNLECFKGGVNTSNQLFKTGPVLAETGTSTPAWLNGTTATKPSEASFDLSSGHLYAEVEKAAVKGTTKGKLKFVGYQDNAPVPLIALGQP
jgi:hypothetical protein